LESKKENGTYMSLSAFSHTPSAEVCPFVRALAETFKLRDC